MMRRTLLVCGLVVGSALGPIAMGQQPSADKAWIAKSNAYTQLLLDVQLKHSPEGGSRQGLAKYDPLITNPTRADEMVQRKELEAVLAKLKKVEAKEKDKNVREDLEILQKTFNLQFRQDDYQLAHKVPFIDASAAVFGGLRGLLDDQVAAERRPAAVVRLRKYAGVEPGYKPFTEIVEAAGDGADGQAGGGVSVDGRDGDGAGAGQELRRWNAAVCLRKYKLTGWEEPFAKLQDRTGGLRHVGSRRR